MKLQWGSATDPGKVRTSNEDALLDRKRARPVQRRLAGADPRRMVELDRPEHGPAELEPREQDEQQDRQRDRELDRLDAAPGAG